MSNRVIHGLFNTTFATKNLYDCLTNLFVAQSTADLRVSAMT